MDRLLSQVPAQLHEAFVCVYNELSAAGRENLEVLVNGWQAAAAGTGSEVTPDSSPAVQDPPCDEFAFMPDVSFMAPRGTFRVGFGQDLFTLQAKNGTKHVVHRDMLLNASILERDNTSCVLFVRLHDGQVRGGTNKKQLPSNLIFTLKGANAGKAKAEISPSSSILITESLRGKLLDEACRRGDLIIAALASCLTTPSLFSRDRSMPPKFRTSESQPALTCKYKTVNDGKLYPLDDGILFVGSPMTFIACTDADRISIEPSVSQRMFTLIVVIRLEKKDMVHEFSQIKQDECLHLQAHLQRIQFAKKKKNKPATDKSGATETSAITIDSQEDGSNREQEGQETEDNAEDSDDDDDSSYRSDSSSSSEEEAEAGKHQDITDGDDKVQVVEDEEQCVHVDEESSSNSSDSSSENDGDDDDGVEKAEMVEEEPFIPEPGDVLPANRKRQRRTIVV